MLLRPLASRIPLLRRCTYTCLSQFSTLRVCHIEEQQQHNRERGVLGLDSLTNILIESIKTTGPISISAYMKQCLTNPEFGYYTTKDQLFGKSGDFITSPEISSIFGETIGIWLYATWLLQQKPKRIQFIEFGPGKGTLMFDALKIFNKLNKDLDVELKIVMIEASGKLRQEQFELLCDESTSFLMQREEDGMFESVTKWGYQIEWLQTEQDIDKLENVAHYIIAHEFFDALPIQQFLKTSNGWREYLVDYSRDDNTFHLVLSPHETPSSLIPASLERFKNLPLNTRVEICPESYLYASKMSQIINSGAQLSNDPLLKGGILICDYGPDSLLPPENSLRGIRDHQFVSPFIDPGKIDLSADVDFTNLSKIFTENGCISYGPVEQGDWLHELGIGYRVDQCLAKIGDDDKAKERLVESYKRLVDPDKMGKIYKFLGVLPVGSQGVFPVGFGGGVIEEA